MRGAFRRAVVRVVPDDRISFDGGGRSQQPPALGWIVGGARVLGERDHAADDGEQRRFNDRFLLVPVIIARER